jgi:hypothetical protein
LAWRRLVLPPETQLSKRVNLTVDFVLLDHCPKVFGWGSNSYRTGKLADFAGQPIEGQLSNNQLDFANFRFGSTPEVQTPLSGYESHFDENWRPRA